MPIFLFPMFGIVTSKVITRGYFQVINVMLISQFNSDLDTMILSLLKDIILLFYGGLVMANAIEISGLHERISLKVLLLFGSNPKWLLLGFMSVTAFMSMWISNAAACSMMLPMVSFSSIDS
jgi:sodium-dependent dicarboxylate transporter 2/3/5